MLRRLCENDNNHGEPELELRLGKPDASGAGFDPDVGFDHCDEFLQRCGSRVPGGVVFTEWIEYTDYHSADPSGAPMRTRARYDADECRVIPQTVRKERLERAEFTANQWLVRCDRALETTVPPNDVPALLHPKSVTCCQRCSALPTCSKWQTPLWRYDVTTRWHGDSAQAVEEQRKAGNSAPVYVVELEYVGGAAALEGLGAVYIATAGLLQLLDVVNAANGPCDHLVTRASAGGVARCPAPGARAPDDTS